MLVPFFRWPSVGEFVDRTEDLAEMRRWWASRDPTPLSLFGRRRCGKSWLLRRFAHGLPAVILVARRTAPGAQLDDFARTLEPLLGVRPDLPDLPTLIRVLYRAAATHKILVVIDEFPYLLPTTEVETVRELTAIAAVMEEEREATRLKLVLCGSLVSQMESLLAERSPLHGRLRPMQLHPVAFPQARLFLPDLDEVRQFERFAMAGGMPRYLDALRGPGSLPDLLCDMFLNPRGALWDEGRAVLEQELREPKVYFAVLQSLATGDKDSTEIANAVRSDGSRVSKYLSVLTQLRLVERRTPAGAAPGSRNGHWHLRDPFLRFWFRFVFPFQDHLEAGLPSRSMFDTEVAPLLHDHIAPEFEDYCRRWTRATQPVTKVDPWWGPSVHAHRRAGTRSSEEIDIVATARGRVTAVGEVRWRSAAMGVSYLREVETYKLPALRQSDLTMARTPTLLLFSRGGYTPELVSEAGRRTDLLLVDVPAALRGEGVTPPPT